MSHVSFLPPVSGLPPLVFGVTMLAASFTFLLLPETRGRPLPQTGEEARMQMEHSMVKQLWNRWDSKHAPT